jgi:hypothetical protein
VHQRRYSARRPSATGAAVYQAARKPLLLELASARHGLVFSASEEAGAVMKAHQTKVDKTLRFKALSIEQRNAIDLLIVGTSDQETADTVGVTRQTIHAWLTSHLLFQSELEQARGVLWRLSAERLRGLMSKALDNIATAIGGGDVKSSFALLKAVGIYGDAEINHIADWRMESLIRQEAERRVKAEGIPMDGTHESLIRLTQNPCYHSRLQEIEAELWNEYGEDRY